VQHNYKSGQRRIDVLELIRIIRTRDTGPLKAFLEIVSVQAEGKRRTRA